MANLHNVGSAGWSLEKLSPLVCLFSKQINFEERTKWAVMIQKGEEAWEDLKV